MMPAPAQSDDTATLTARKLAPWLILILLVAVVAVQFSGALKAAWLRVNEVGIEATWHLVVALALFAIAVPLSGVLWGRILSQLEGRTVEPRQAAKIHCLSWLLKYIPGQVGALLSKILWGKRQGFRTANVASSFVYENLFLQVASLIPGGVILLLALGAATFSMDEMSLVVVAAISVIGMFFLIGPSMRLAMQLLGPRIAQKIGGVELQTLSSGQGLRYSALFILPRILNAVGFVFIVCALQPVEPADWMALGAAYVVAGAIGILAVFVPSGLGVREAAIVVLTQPVIGTSNAIIAAVLARLVSVASDGVVALIYFMLVGRKLGVAS